MCDQIKLKLTGDERIVVASRDALTRGSNYFEALLSARFAEVRAIELDMESVEVPFEVFKDVVQFNDPKINRKTIKSLLIATDFFQLEGLRGKLAKAILEDSTNEVVCSANVLDLWLFTRMSGEKNKEIQAALEKYIAGNLIAEIMNEPSLLTLDSESLEMILERDDLKVDTEKQVFFALKLWINFDKEERAKQFGRLVYCMRFDATVEATFLDSQLLGLSEDCDEVKKYVELFKELLGNADLRLSSAINSKERTGKAKDKPLAITVVLEPHHGDSLDDLIERGEEDPFAFESDYYEREAVEDPFAFELDYYEREAFEDPFAFELDYYEQDDDPFGYY